MCGISGYIDINRQTAPQELLRITETIKHRGPDGEGYVFINNKESLTCFGNDTSELIKVFESAYKPKSDVRELENTFQVGLGHRRLAILDVSPRGHMPMCNQEQTIWLTYNGEVYNYKELKTELSQLGYQFTTETDSEVIIKAYQQWGTDCLNHFLGMFAIAIFDTTCQKLFLARDRFGIKPLYYYTNNNGAFYFASEIKQFFNTKNWQASISNQRAYDYLFYSLTDHTDETLFKYVYHIPAAHFFFGDFADLPKQQGVKLKLTKWYTVTPTQTDLTYTDACKQFNMLFERAVSQHLRADVPLAAALSGGLDSSAIVCQALKILKQQLSNTKLSTFSSVAKDERYSEKKWIDEVIKHTGVNANFVYPGPERLLELSSKLLWHMDEPYQSQSTYLGYHVFEMAAKSGIKVLLNGQGADEYLSGYQEFKRLSLTKDLFKLNLKSYKAKMRKDHVSNGNAFKLALNLVLNQTLPQSLKQKGTRLTGDYAQIKQLLQKEWKQITKDTQHPLASIQYQTNNHISISLLQMFHTSLPKYLRWEDRNSMAHGVEARVPFLDHNLVEFTLGLPLHYLTNRNNCPKPLLSDSLKDILPASIANRKDKMGFITPEQQWIETADGAELFHTFFKEIKNTPFFESDKVFGFFSKLKNKEIPFTYNYWRIISLVNWYQLNNIND